MRFKAFDYAGYEVFLCMRFSGGFGFAHKWKAKLLRDKLMFTSTLVSHGPRQVLYCSFYQAFPNWESEFLRIRMKYNVQHELITDHITVKELQYEQDPE